MHPAKIEAAAGIDTSYRGVDHLRIKAVRSVARAFAKNMDRVLAAHTILMAIVNRRWIEARAARRIHSSPSTLSTSSSKVGIPSLPPSAGSRVSEAIDDMIATSVVADRRIIDEGFQAILALLITGTWTAFEALAGDLWESAVNVCPEPLARLRGRKREIELEVADRVRKQIGSAGTKKTKPNSEDSQSGQQGRQESKQVFLDSIVEVTGNSFDLRKKMGELLRTRYEFSTLESARQAYSSAFWCECAQIRDSLADISIDSLSLVRNLLVHKAGVADQKYVDKMPATFAPVLNLKQPLKLDGTMVCDLVNPVVNQAVNLIKSVDEWIHDQNRGKHPAVPNDA
jgi:hypothetical protein